jgi:hypothetical protein
MLSPVWRVASRLPGVKPVPKIFISCRRNDNADAAGSILS